MLQIKGFGSIIRSYHLPVPKRDRLPGLQAVGDRAVLKKPGLKSTYEAEGNAGGRCHQRRGRRWRGLRLSHGFFPRPGQTVLRVVSRISKSRRRNKAVLYAGILLHLSFHFSLTSLCRIGSSVKNSPCFATFKKMTRGKKLMSERCAAETVLQAQRGGGSPRTQPVASRTHGPALWSRREGSWGNQRACAQCEVRHPAPIYHTDLRESTRPAPRHSALIDYGLHGPLNI